MDLSKMQPLQKFVCLDSQKRNCEKEKKSKYKKAFRKKLKSPKYTIFTYIYMYVL